MRPSVAVPAEPRRDPLPLRGRSALVTGASRRAGIGHAVARRPAAYGAGVHPHHHVAHDADMQWPDTVNTVNPGPVDTGCLIGDAHEAVATRFPAGHLGGPDGPARLVARPATDEAARTTGQVIDSEGGSRHRQPDRGRARSGRMCASEPRQLVHQVVQAQRTL